MRFFVRTVFIILFSLLLAAGVLYMYLGSENPEAFKTFILNEINGDNQSTSIDSLYSIPPAEKRKPVFKLLPVPTNPFEDIDRYARNTPSKAEENIATLAEYLGRIAKTDLEKARVIYVWLTDRIRYDDVAFNKQVYGDTGAEAVLRTRKSVCDGFSELYLALGTEMGLDIKKVVGFAKGYNYKPGDKFKVSDHAWNIIKINNEWKVFDATWGEGYGSNVNGKLVSTKQFKDYWFNVNPYDAIFTHYPEDSALSFIEPSISLSSYEKFPYVSQYYFNLGFPSEEIFNMVTQNPDTQFPETYSVDTYIRILTAPSFKELFKVKTYTFRVHVPRGFSVVMIDAEEGWHYFDRDTGIFSINYTPEKPGPLKILVQHENSKSMFSAILKYEVVD